jgi:hypothetical protein
MSKRWLAGLATLAVASVCAAVAGAEDVSAKKVLIKDNPNPAKRMILVLSTDTGVALSEADTPSVNQGASVHVYSATDDSCALLPQGADWTSTPTAWKYRNPATRNFARIKDGKLLVRIKSNVAYTLADDGTQGPVNVQVQFGTGTRYCMRCDTPTRNDDRKYLAKLCAAAPCDPEPSLCIPGAVTTTSTSTTTTSTAIGIILQGVLPQTTGLFNYNLTTGLAGADSACTTNFPGSSGHCTYAELLNAEAAGELVGITDMNGMTVNSFWAIDGAKPDTLQCGFSIPWDYQTAHTGHYGEKVNLTNGTGDLGPLLSGQPDGVGCGGGSWVGCCQ